MASGVHGFASLGYCRHPTSIRTRISRFPSGALSSGSEDIEGRCDTTLIGLLWFLTDEVAVREASLIIGNLDEILNSWGACEVNWRRASDAPSFRNLI